MAKDGKIRKEDLFDDSAFQGMSEMLDLIMKVSNEFKNTIKNIQALNKAAANSKSQKEFNKVVADTAKEQNAAALASKKFEVQMQRVELSAKKNEVATKKFNEAQERGTKNTNTWGKAMGSFAAKFNTIGNVASMALGKIISSISRTVKEFISFEKIINSTQATGDKFAVSMAGAKGATEAFARAVASGDFSNFFDKLKDGFKAARDFALVMDDLADRQRAVNFQAKETQLEILKLEGILKNRGKTDLERKAAGEEIIRITEKQFKTEKDLADIAKQNQRDLLKNTHNLSDAQVEGVINYIKQYDKLTPAQYEQIALVRDLKKEVDLLNVASTDRVAPEYTLLLAEGAETAAQKYERLYKALTDQEKAYLRLDPIVNNVIDTQRDGIAAVETAWLDAEIKLQTYLNSAERGLARIKDGLLDPEITKSQAEQLANEIDAWSMAELEKAEAGKEIRTDFAKWWKQYNKELQEDEVDDTEDIEREKANIKAQMYLQSFDLLNSLTQRSLESTRAAMEQEIALAGGSAEAREGIEEKYHKKMRKLQQQQAIIDRAAALFNIGINTQEAVTKATAKGWLPLIPFIYGLGALAAIKVLATPIPAFAKGTDSSPEGAAIVGEKGRELMIDKQGNISLSPDTSTLTYLQKGTKIIPADLTADLMKGETNKSSGLLREMKLTNSLLSELKGKPVHTININSAGLTVMEQRGRTKMRHIDKYFK